VLQTQPGAQGSSARLIAGAAITVIGSPANTRAKAPTPQCITKRLIADLRAIATAMSVLLPASDSWDIFNPCTGLFERRLHTFSIGGRGDKRQGG
jgi:hypothetical protein